VTGVEGFGAQKKPGEDDREPLEYQENVNKIKGSQARNVMMQKLMRRSEVCMFVTLWPMPAAGLCEWPTPFPGQTSQKATKPAFCILIWSQRL